MGGDVSDGSTGVEQRRCTCPIIGERILELGLALILIAESAFNQKIDFMVNFPQLALNCDIGEFAASQPFQNL
jgi:hypothetical protein